MTPSKATKRRILVHIADTHGATAPQVAEAVGVDMVYAGDLIAELCQDGYLTYSLLDGWEPTVAGMDWVADYCAQREAEIALMEASYNGN